MRLSYHPETDSLYIHLTEKPGADVVEVSDSVAVDVDEHGTPVGIDIDANASKIVDLSRLETDGLLLSLTPAEPRKPGRPTLRNRTLPVYHLLNSKTVMLYFWYEQRYEERNEREDWDLDQQRSG